MDKCYFEIIILLIIIFWWPSQAISLVEFGFLNTYQKLEVFEKAWTLEKA
jgi:hypothetical protein